MEPPDGQVSGFSALTVEAIGTGKPSRRRSPSRRRRRWTGWAGRRQRWWSASPGARSPRSRGAARRGPASRQPGWDVGTGLGAGRRRGADGPRPAAVSPAAGKPERADAGLPGRRSRGLDVLVDVPERAVVARVDVQRRVVAPAAAHGLRAGAVDQDLLALRQLPDRFPGEAAGVYRMPGNTVALDTLKPSARLPRRSMAALPIQRCTPSLGA